jgi:soluble lytic murein transglycosylase-like protein
MTPACTLALALLAHGPSAPATCEAVAAEARRQGVSVPLAVAVAGIESRWNAAAVGSRGEAGPLQVLSRYWPGEPIEAGVRAIRQLVERYGIKRGLCVYNAGNAGREMRTCRYARRVLSLRKEIER